MPPSKAPNELNGLRGYVEKVKRFSRNARLYLLHVIGMDLIHGTWEVLFNLYLLEIGYGLEFLGLRLAVIGVSGALASIPMGRLSDKVGRKLGFILGDGGGAAMSLVQIMSANPVVLLVAPAIGAAFGSLHHVTEPAFMAENSARSERVHLFSVSDGLRTLSAMAGSLIAGFAPLWAVAHFQIDKVAAYRYATLIGIGWWFLSLIPALLLKQRAPERAPAGTRTRSQGPQRGWRKWVSNVKNPVIIGKLLLVNGLISLGAGFVVPLFNVFFQEGIHAQEYEIGTTFAAGSLFLALGTFLIPFAAERLGKVSTVVLSRLVAIPFVMLIGFAPDLADPTTVVSIAGLAYILRTTFFNMSSPVVDAFSMELLHPSERATAIGFQAALGRIAAATTGFLGALLMSVQDYRTPFFLMALCYALSTFLFWALFRRLEQQPLAEAGEGVALAEA